MKAKLEEAKELAAAHRKTDPATRVVKFFPAEYPDQLRLLEVTTSVPTTGEVMPFTFSADPHHGIDYISTVILLSPDEWNDVRVGKLSLPPGWDISTAEDV